MKNVSWRKRVLSAFIAFVVAFTAITPALTASAADGVIDKYEIQLFYKATDTAVPKTQEDGATPYIEYMKEGEKLELTYKPIDGTVIPDNSYVKWYSETPTLVDVDQNGVVKAFDSSKGAVVQTWIDNEVKTIPLVGKLMATVIEKALFNDYVNVDTMDTEEIVKIVEGAFGEDSLLDKVFESYKGELVNSLRRYLDNINSNIHVQLYDKNGELLADDYVQICVNKNDAWYANFLPNGTHITNKSQINTTVAVGSTVQLYAITTPVRLKFGTVYSVKSTSVFDQGKVVATVNDSGLVTFKNTGKVTIMVSPDTEQIIEGILKLVNYIYKLDNTGTLDTDKIAGILIDYIGIDMNRAVLAAILDVCFAIKDIVGDTADPVQLTATAVEIISNLVLQFVYNDTITFNVVESQPLTDFAIEGPSSVKEGTQIQMGIGQTVPDVGDVTDITWSSSDPSIASIDPKTGIVTGRDAGGSLGSASTQTCTITATSAANNVSKSVTLTVTGRTGRYLSDVEIVGPDYIETNEEADFAYSVYPKRVAESDNLYIRWGMLTGHDENNEPVYTWADEENPATDGFGRIDSKGHYTSLNGGTSTIIVEAKTGYYITSDRFYEISSYKATKDVENGKPVSSISLTALDKVYLGTLTTSEKEINGENHKFATVKLLAGTILYLNGIKVKADINPADATNKKIVWHTDNNNFYFDNEDKNAGTIEVRVKEGVEYASAVNIWCTSEDGRVKSEVLTLSVTRNYATSNAIDNKDNISVTNGKTIDVSHSMTFSGSWTDEMYACYDANWYSSDEEVFTVKSNGERNGNAVITGVDVGTATLYCVSTDGGILDTCTVTVYPDKDYLRNIVRLCDSTVVKRTTENKRLYNDYMKKLDLAYYALYDTVMVSQTTCDTYAKNLLYSFYKLGGFVGIGRVEILGANKAELENKHVTVNVGAVTSYKKYSYDFDFKILPANSMYSEVTWTSSSDKITVDKNGICKPVDNDPCAAVITCTVKDYMGTEISDSVYISFARTQVTGVTLNTTTITGGKIGTTQKLTATVSPDRASCPDVYWTSSDEAIASVAQDGTVTFNRGGDCIITCTTYDGGFTAECAVDVVTNYDNLRLLINQYVDLGINPSNYYPDSYQTYMQAMEKARRMIELADSSQDEVDAMYNELEAAYNGLEKYNYLQKIELYLDGEATKEFYQYDLSLLKEGLSYKNAVLDLNVRLYPNNGSYESVKWESSTTDISVTTEGRCTPTANKSCYGMITCTVTDHFGNTYTDSVWVSYAYVPVTSVEISETSIAGSVGGTAKLTHVVQPSGLIKKASIQNVYWESDDESVATVDQEGNVTFVSAGSTTIRVISYDGGHFAECRVSTQGDRNALKAAIEQYKDIDYTDYEYTYAMEFKDAYAQAEEALTNETISQQAIDAATDRLVSAGTALASHPFIKVESIRIDWTGNNKLSGKVIESGTVGSNDAVSIAIDETSGYGGLHYNNTCVLNATALPEGSMYDSLSWRVVETAGDMETAADGASIKLNPAKTSSQSFAVVEVTATDCYGRTVTRTINVVIAKHKVSGISIEQSDLTMKTTSAPVQLTANITSSNGNVNDLVYKGIVWTSSDPNIVSVDSNGLVTPVNSGEAVITAKTVDGGFTAQVNVTVQADFEQLAAKVSEYTDLINSVKDKYEYTPESLEVLSQAVAQAKTMVDENKASQAEINEMYNTLTNAYNSLERYILVDNVNITFGDTESEAKEINPGFYRLKAATLNGKTVSLKAVCEPENSLYETMEWSSSNPDVKVNADGLVSNSNGNSKASLITCTVTNINGVSHSASVYVSFVRSEVTAISFGDTVYHGAPAMTQTIVPDITYSGTTALSSMYVDDCIWSSSNPEIATVNENGVVTFVSQGTATITATTMDGGFTASTEVFTTWDTTALKSALDSAKAINYMDYAYSYGTAFNTAYINAKAVYDNVNASQAEIDTACTALVEAMSALEGHKFVVPVLSIVSGANTVADGATLETDENAQAVISASVNEGAMIKSTSWSYENAVGVTVTENSSGLVLQKTALPASVTVTYTAVDDYDREYKVTRNINLVDRIVKATDIVLTANGEQIGSAYTYHCTEGYKNINLTLGYVPTPQDANTITSVSYKVTSLGGSVSIIRVDETTGKITMGSLAGTRDHKATITCTVTNSDGTTVSKSVDLTVTTASA